MQYTAAEAVFRQVNGFNLGKFAILAVMVAIVFIVTAFGTNSVFKIVFARCGNHKILLYRANSAIFAYVALGAAGGFFSYFAFVPNMILGLFRFTTPANMNMIFAVILPIAKVVTKGIKLDVYAVGINLSGVAVACLKSLCTAFGTGG